MYVCVHMHSLLVLTGAISGSPEPGIQEADVVVLAKSSVAFNENYFPISYTSDGF